MINQNQIYPTTQKFNLSQKEKFHLPLFFPDKFQRLLPKIPEVGKIDDSPKPNLSNYSKITSQSKAEIPSTSIFSQTNFSDFSQKFQR